MPGSAGSLELTDSYREQLLTLRQQAARGVSSSWQLITLQDLDRSFAAWQAAAAALIMASNSLSVRLADAYLAAYLSSELGRQVAPARLDAARYVHALDGRTVAAVLLPPLFTVKTALATLADDRTALSMGLNRALATTSREVVGTARAAQRDAMLQSEHVTGWRRAASPNACGACLGAADGQTYEVEVLLEVHTHCRCVAEPVVAGVTETVRRPTGQELFDSLTAEEQNMLFKGRGGRDKAELIRSGRIRLADLVAKAPMATVADQITEASLVSLTT